MSDSSYSVHVISGLPRSGSTLLAALLRQNPQIIAASHNTPVMPMLIRIMSLMSEGEYRTEFKNGQWQRLMRGILQSYLNPDAQKHVMLDINREWCAHAGLLGRLYPKAKIICCVRDPVWILNSFEHLITRDPLLGSRLVPITHRGTQHDRIDYLASREGAFGYAWRLLTEVFFGPFADKVIIIDYDKLVREPVFVMERLTQLLNIQPFAYNFEYIETPDVDAFDAALGTPGLHYLRQSVAASRKRLILPPHIVERMAHQMFWRKPDLNSGGAVVIA
ncbi:sulfotransferase [Acetobacter pasteurianus NBRC 101655]|uniref:sulfotransferase family protein n=1 Tax=Acetobacter pasteurianus TaxID=438 RepID=UPI0002457372|nr:sulfotransferase [Acetobacter pasteurianus]BAU38772.1 sulfotransferase [Acetobacter pasteurianus NBRC 101655]